jgi:hypothetical protein
MSSPRFQQLRNVGGKNREDNAQSVDLRITVAEESDYRPEKVAAGENMILW